MVSTKPGSALVAATLLAALLALTAASLIARARTSRAAAAEEVRFEQARLAAEGAIAEALAALDAGVSISSPFQVGPATVSVQDTTELVDLNTADADGLRSALEAAGAGARAAVLADRILDWRDEDSLRRAEGAEADSYAAAGMAAPRNGPFVIEEETALVLGISAALAACLASHVTVHGAAPVRIEAVRVDPFAGVEASAPQAEAEAEGASADGDLYALNHVLRIEARAPFSESADLRVTRWVRFTGDPRRPLLTHRTARDLIPSAPKDATCPRQPAA